jgi:hypothetical protein
MIEEAVNVVFYQRSREESLVGGCQSAVARQPAQQEKDLGPGKLLAGSN